MCKKYAKLALLINCFIFHIVKLIPKEALYRKYARRYYIMKNEIPLFGKRLHISEAVLDGIMSVQVLSRINDFI